MKFPSKSSSITEPTAAFDESSLTENPLDLARTWLHHAQESQAVIDYNAMCLSTVSDDGYPDARMVLLRELGPRGFVFYSNSLSAKGRALQLNAKGALTFFWDPLRRQLRARGNVETVSPVEADAYFRTRPRRTQIGAWASQQSSLLDDRATLDRKIAELELAWEGQDVPRPPHWMGYLLVPFQIEFWQERANRLHDRFQYSLHSDGGWKVQRLYP